MEATISILLGFLEGFVLILSPCILPILPIILATSLSGSKRRPIGITLGFIFNFSIYAFFSRQWVQSAYIDVNLLRALSYGILFLLGWVMISDKLSHYWEKSLSFLQQLPVFNLFKHDGFISGFIFGGLISLIWVPCAGPILAAVIVQTVLQKADVQSFLVLLAFATGAILPMLWIAVYGKSLIFQSTFFKTKLVSIRKIMGAVLMLTVVWLSLGSSPSSQKNLLKSTQTAEALQQGLLMPYPAPELTGIRAWLNSSALSLKQLRGKVVVLDFWTFSCINCVRTIPLLNALYGQYHQNGLELIGIHAPEFAFEQDSHNVQKAIVNNKIRYPVALDNDFSTWSAYHNQYWPAQYLIDQQGNVVYMHFGEGGEGILENNIRYLLKENPKKFERSENLERGELTPETYLGLERSDPNMRPISSLNYAYPNHLFLNAWGLQGKWETLNDHIVNLEAEAGLRIHFRAKKVFMVMGTTNATPVMISIKLDGKTIHDRFLVQDHTLYQLLNLNESIDGILEVQIHSPGLAVYTLTFG